MNRKNMTDMTDMNNCKHYCSDKENCKKIETLKTDYMNEMNDYQKYYLDDKIDSAVQTVKIWQI